MAARTSGPATLDLNFPDIQRIGDGFMVSQLSTESTADGVRVRGRVINSTAVRHRKARFQIGAGRQNATFEIGLISPGNSTGFEVLLPGLTPTAARRASIAYLGSTVNYFDHSLRGVNGEVAASR